MSPFIPEAKLLEIKNAASIAEVIGQYVSLKRRGRYLVGLCPFHAEKTPSFTVYPERQIFHCFGCGAGGNVFTFLMQIQRLTFPEAVQELAQRYGIPLQWQQTGRSEEDRQRQQRQEAYQVNELAAKFFAANLHQPQRGEVARRYLEQRGLPLAVAASFQLGYAPDEWRLLVHHLTEHRASLPLAQQLGLIAAGSEGSYYDRFRGRLIFPIVDLQGRIIAFGGRIIGAGEPKYLNSPESLLYTKGRHLYGLYQAKEAIRRQDLALVVEGYLDLLALRARGIEPVVATLGTALTRDQVRLLKGHASRVVLVFDGDAAGLKAMQRCLPLFAAERLPVRVLRLPEGEDPDSYVARQGAEIFIDPWDRAIPLFEFVLEETAAGADSWEGKLAAVSRLKPYFQEDLDPIQRTLWLQLVAKRLDLPEGALAREFSPTASRTMPGSLGSPALAVNFERGFLKLILTHPEILAQFNLADYLELFTDESLKKLAWQVYHCQQQLGYLDHSLLLTQLGDEDLGRELCALTLACHEFDPTKLQELVADYCRGFAKRSLKQQREQLKARLCQFYQEEKGGDFLALIAQVQDLEQKLRDLDCSP